MHARLETNLSSGYKIEWSLLAYRYLTLEQNWDKHKPEMSDEENVKAFNTFTPGYPYRPEVDMEPHIPDSCTNKAKVGLALPLAKLRILCNIITLSSW